MKLIEALGHARTMHDAVPPAVFLLMPFQLGFQAVGVSKIQLGETDAPVLQVLPAAAPAHARPYLHPALQPAFDEETPDEAARARH